MRTAFYIRVSTADQNSALQRKELEQYVQANGWEIAEVYEDAMSGAKSGRPGLLRLLADAGQRKFDAVLVWELDRFGRSLVGLLEQHPDAGRRRHTLYRDHAAVRHQRERSSGQVSIACAGSRRGVREVFDQGEGSGRAQGRAQVREGLWPAPVIFDRTEVVELRQQGMNIRAIGKQLGLSMGTITRTLAEAA